jgi:transposase-like protein
MNYLSNPIFQDADKARDWLEVRLWAAGRSCPHCGAVDDSTKIGGTTARPGLYMCNACRKQFTVTVGTVFERSHIPLNKWLMALFLLVSSKKGISAHQMHRMLGVSYKSTWFMMHRLREALREGMDFGPMGGNGKPVEVDETFFGGYRRGRGMGGGVGHKDKVMSIVERDGKVRSFHVPNVSQHTLRPILKEQIAEDATVYTDEASHHRTMGRDFGKHEHVNHRFGEYVRGDVHTNTAEGYFSILKRGIGGVYQCVSEKHLKRYVCEFDFRYNYRIKLGCDDAERFAIAAKGIKGKRLTYRRTNGADA